MHELYELKKMLCKELEEYGRNGEMSTGSLDIVDKLAHAIKNIEKILEAYEEEEGSYAYRGGSYEGSYDNRGRGRGSYRGSYRDGSYRDGSYARRRRDSRGRYMSNYSMEGYSRAAADQLREMMDDMPDEQTRNELQRIVTKMENM